MQYYELLEIKRDADGPTIKKQYRILAQKYHPSLHPERRVEYERKYREVTEAYEVLSNPKLRVIYDAYGEDGLKNGVPDATGAVVGGTYSFTSNPDDVLRETFGRNPFTEYFDFEGASRTEIGQTFNEFSQMSIRPPPEKLAPEKYDLPCTLEELYNGATMRAPITKTVVLPDGATTRQVTETLLIKLRPGMREGTMIRFPGAGSTRPNQGTADIIFTVTCKPHLRFRRDGDNLRFTASITLGQALLGTNIDVPTLDGRLLSIAITDIVRPGYVKVIKGEGMPVMTAPPAPPGPPPPVPTPLGVPPTAAATPTTPVQPPAPVEALVGKVIGRGDLLIDFDVKYPAVLTPRQKEAVLGAGF